MTTETDVVVGVYNPLFIESNLELIDITTLFYIIEPMILNVVSDIVISHPVDADLKYVKHKLYEDLKLITGKNHFFFDTDICKTVKWLFSDVDVFKKSGHALISAIGPWVSSCHTHWNGDMFTSILRIFDSLNTLPNINNAIKLEESVLA